MISVLRVMSLPIEAAIDKRGHCVNCCRVGAFVAIEADCSSQ